MARIVAVAPTVADAVHSVGGTLARHAADGHEVVVIAVFEEIGPDHEAVAGALAVAGIVAVGAQQPAGHDDEPPVAALAVALARIEPDLILAPIGLDGEPPGRLIGAALDRLDLPRMRWLDLPYALHRTPGAPLGAGELLAVPIGRQLDAKARAQAITGGADAAAVAEHARREGERLGAGEPVELLLRPTDPDPSRQRF